MSQNCRGILCQGTLKSFNFEERLEAIHSASKTKKLSSHQCGSGSNPSVDAICEMSLLPVLYFAPRGFSSPCTPVLLTPQKSTFPNFNSTRNGCAASNSLFIYFSYLFLVFVVVFLTDRSTAPVKWIAPSAMTMKCVFQITKITVCDVFVSLDIPEHLAVSYIKNMAMS